MIKFTRVSLAETTAGKLLQNQKVLERKVNFREKLQENPNMIKGGYEQGWIQVGDRVLFVRSRWEANICAYLEFLKENNKIKRWGYEQKTFWFKGIARGTNSYKPDFVIEENDGTEVYIEVKAFWTPKDTVKMNRMKKYFPYVEIFVIADDKCYNRMTKQFPNLAFKKYGNYDHIKQSAFFIKGWNQPFLKREQVEHLIPLKVKKQPKKALK